MSAFFYIKNHFRKILSVFLACWFLLIASVLCVIINVQKVPINKNFYFLVSKSTHIQASTHYVAWTGGAGYLLEKNGREYVVYSVYLEKEDGINVQAALTDKDTELLTLSVETLYLYSNKAKKNKDNLTSACSSFYSCLLVLEECINILSSGGTQEMGKELLAILQKQMYYLKKEYKTFPYYQMICRKGEEKINQLKNGTIFLKDLRYLFCELVVGFLNFSKIY